VGATCQKNWARPGAIIGDPIKVPGKTTIYEFFGHLVHEMLFILKRKPELKVQTESIGAKFFV